MVEHNGTAGTADWTAGVQYWPADLTQTAIHAIIKSCPLPTSVFIVLDCGTLEPCISASSLQVSDQLLVEQFFIIH